jgi:predicted nuclease of restriction endonuclease-like (RecB) superfamily
MHTSQGDLYSEIKSILTEAQAHVARAVNTVMVHAYWNIGRLIVENEQQGAQRAEYGAQLITQLSRQLTLDFGKGFTEANLRYMRLFYQRFPIRHALRDNLSWTHYRLLTKVEKENARSFYEDECSQENWSTRELERQISTLTYERMLMSSDKEVALRENRETARTTSQKYNPQDIIKDPYVLEFLGLQTAPHLTESELEDALITHLQRFMLELGKGFSFVGRQERLTLDGDHFYIDLVFYNRFLRCFVLVDLKTGKLTHQDIGQMQLYVNYYTRELREDHEEPAIGIILCADKNEAVVRYTLPENQSTIFASKFKLYVPSEEQLAQELQREQEKQRLLIATQNTEENP